MNRYYRIWKPQDDLTILEMTKEGYSDKEIAECLMRPLERVQFRKWQLNVRRKKSGLEGITRYKYWTEEEEQYLVENYKTTSTPEVLAHLNGKTVKQLQYKVHKLGLRRAG